MRFPSDDGMTPGPFSSKPMRASPEVYTTLGERLDSFRGSEDEPNSEELIAWLVKRQRVKKTDAPRH